MRSNKGPGVIKRTVVAIGFLLTLGGVAHAASSLVTPFLMLTTGDSLNCGITNASTKKTVTIAIEVLDTFGTVLSGNGIPTTKLGPGVSVGQSVGATSFPATCRFTVKGGKRKVRARACVISGGRCTAVAEAK